MSAYAQFDEAGEQVQVASNSGWGEFIDWVETTKAKALLALVDNGHSEDLTGILRDLESLKDSNRSADVADIADGLEQAIRENVTAEILLITNGAGT